MPILRSVVPALVVAFVLGGSVGCSSSDSGSGVSPDGGSSNSEGGGGGGGGGSGGGGDGGGTGSCTATTTDAIANDPKLLVNLTVTATSLVFLSVPQDVAAAPASIETANLDGSGRTTLYTSAGDRRIHSMQVQGDTAYFFEVDNAAPDPVDELWSIPLAGGAPARVGTLAYHRSPRFFGSDANSVYVSYTTDQAPAGNRFDRISTADGTMENAAFLPDRGSENMVKMVGNDVFFWSGQANADTGRSVFHFDKTATAATPTALPGGLDVLCDITTAGMFVTPTKVACGSSGLNAYNHDGSGVQALIAKDPLHLGPNVLVASDAETLFVLDRGASMSGGGTIRKIASTGGAVTPVACDVQTVQNHVAESFFPIQTEYEVVVGATDVYWIEKHGVAPSLSWFVRHAPK